MEEKSKVYALADSLGRILRIEGGYTTGNIADPENWVLIDEGTGDRYNLCQSNYLPGPIMDDRGICRYKLVDGAPMERTQAEMDGDYMPPVQRKTQEERIAELDESNRNLEEQLIETQIALCDSYEYQLMVEEQLTDTQVALCDLYEMIEMLLGGV